jgi:hypothetical protein
MRISLTDYQISSMYRYIEIICTKARLRKPDHMKKLPPRGFDVTMNPQEKKTQRRFFNDTATTEIYTRKHLLSPP